VGWLAHKILIGPFREYSKFKFNQYPPKTCESQTIQSINTRPSIIVMPAAGKNHRQYSGKAWFRHLQDCIVVRHTVSGNLRSSARIMSQLAKKIDPTGKLVLHCVGIRESGKRAYSRTPLTRIPTTKPGMLAVDLGSCT
jgi:hypothetical protein